LILIAQDLTYYGLDLTKQRTLSDLLKRLSDLEGLDWIRLQYAYPAGFPLDVLDVIAERPNICKYLDMPLQHGSTKMLKVMRRGITREKTEELIATIRAKVPNIALRTTLIAGHPQETEDDFEEMMTFVKNSRFDRLGVFAYSHEENTHSHSYADDVPAEVKEARTDQIMEVQESISAALNQEKIGKTYKVLIDRKESGFWVGRTEHDSPEVDNEVLIDAKDTYCRMGDFVHARITDATEFDLYAETLSL
jgi:ribosomal protein S12 methylthiotransferase